MRNWPRYSRGSLEAEEITRPVRKKIFFSTRLLEITSVPVFCPRLSHWSRSPGSIVRRLPERPIEGARLYPPLSMLPERGEGSRVRRSLAGKKAGYRRRDWVTRTVVVAVEVLPLASVVSTVIV